MKRPNGEGNIYQRANGRWEGRITYADPETGENKRRAVYGRTLKEARDKMKAARARIDAGVPVTDSTQSLADWLQHWRATTLEASNRKASTKELYANLSRKHLEPPPFGVKRLDKLKPSDVEGLVLAMRKKTKPAKSDDDEPTRALSDSTIRTTYTVLRAALDGAVRDGLLARNPAAQVKRPGVERVEARCMTGDEVSAILTAAEGSRYHTALLLIAATGLRRGECLALMWDALDLENGSLKVAATIGRVGNKLVASEPKTQRSRRTMPLPPSLVAVLKAHRKTQIEDSSRKVVEFNAERERVRYLRHAEPGARPFCRLMAIRGPVFKSAANAIKGHDSCHCVAIPVREGTAFNPPEHYASWDRQYVEVTKGLRDDGEPVTFVEGAERYAGCLGFFDRAVQARS